MKPEGKKRVGVSFSDDRRSVEVGRDPQGHPLQPSGSSRSPRAARPRPRPNSFRASPRPEAASPPRRATSPSSLSLSGPFVGTFSSTSQALSERRGQERTRVSRRGGLTTPDSPPSTCWQPSQDAGGPRRRLLAARTPGLNRRPSVYSCRGLWDLGPALR